MKFQFSLKALLLVTLVAGVGFGTYLKWTENERSIAALEKAGAIYHWHTHTEERVPRGLSLWEQYASVEFSLSSWLGESADARALRGVRRLKRITLNVDQEYLGQAGYFPLRKVPIDPETVREILAVPSFEELTLFSDVSEEQWEQLTQHPRLRVLRGEYLVFQDRSLASLVRLPHVEELALEHADRANGNTGLPELATMRQLVALTLEDVLLDDETLDAIQKLPKLKRLTLRDNWFLSEGSYRALKSMTSLRELEIDSGRGFEFQDSPPNLQSLRLPWYYLTKDDLQQLARLTQLEDLAVLHKDFVDLELELIGTTLPNLRRFEECQDQYLDGTRGPFVYVRGRDGKFQRQLPVGP